MNLSTCRLIVEQLSGSLNYEIPLDDLRDSLSLGCLCGTSEKINACISMMFYEIHPELIDKCARELGSSITLVNQLYQETLSQLSAPQSPIWEYWIRDHWGRNSINRDDLIFL